MKKWKWEKGDLFILLIRIDGEGNSRLGSRRTSRRGVRRNLQRKRCNMLLRWICCWAKGIILLGQQGVENLPGLVDEEEEPLEVANCGVAEIQDIFEKFQRKGYGMIETLPKLSWGLLSKYLSLKRQSFAKFWQDGVKLSGVTKLLSATSSIRSATQSTTLTTWVTSIKSPKHQWAIDKARQW